MSKNKDKSPLGTVAAFAVFGLLVFLATRQYYKQGDGISTFDFAAGEAPSRTIRKADTAESLAALGDSYFETGRYGEAIGAYRRAIELDPEDADSHNDLGLALHYTGKSGDAVAELKKATELAPSLQRAWLSLGFVLKAIEREGEARRALEKAVALEPSSPQAAEAKKMLGR